MMAFAMTGQTRGEARLGEVLSPDATPEPSSIPRPAVPALRCDCHVHVFDPARFPYVPQRTYTPGPATVAELRVFLERMGMERVVLVQPSAYGTDNRCLVDALAQLGTRIARGVAVIESMHAPPQDLADLHAKGVRAIRLNLEVNGERGSVRTREALRRAIEVVKPLGWAIQIYADLPLIDRVSDDLARSPVPIVLDHFGGLKTGLGLRQQGFDTLLELVRTSEVYVKLSAPYRASTLPQYDDLADFVRALAQAGPNRLVWASDWPHTGSSGKRRGDRNPLEPFRNIDDRRVIDRITQWLPDVALHHRIFVENAERLYQFGVPRS